MEVETLAAIAVEADELVRRQIVAGQGERHDERAALLGEEQLAAVGMIVGVPHQDARAVGLFDFFRRLLGIAGPADQIAVVDRLVLAVEHVALPIEGELALGRTAFIAGIGVDRPPALCRPAHDLDLRGGEIVDQHAVALQRLGRGLDDRDLVAIERLVVAWRKSADHGASPLSAMGELRASSAFCRLVRSRFRRMSLS